MFVAGFDCDSVENEGMNMGLPLKSTIGEGACCLDVRTLTFANEWVFIKPLKVKNF